MFSLDDTLYPQADWEELNGYLFRAVAAYEARCYSTIETPPVPDHPYKFLYPFGLEDATIFFGRTTRTEELFTKVINNRLTLLHARTGAGKTSFLNAGLGPRLIRDSRLPIYTRTRPYQSDPFRELKQAIAPPSIGPWPKLLLDLPIHEFLRLVCNHLSAATREIVFIIDQFEQFLLSISDPNVRLPFIKILSELYEDKTLPVRFIFAVRQEYLGDFDEFERFIPQILQNRYKLPLMTQAEVREAITGPLLALKKDLSIEPALLEELIETLATNGIELTHLQIICTKLYDSLPLGINVISLAHYQSRGQAEGILADYLDDTLAALPDSKQAVARNALKQLVSSQATNRILSWSELSTLLRLDASVTEDVLQYLVETRLLRREDSPSGKEFELAHSYLAEQVIHWIGQDDLENKRAQELLQRELASWRVHKTIVDEEKLNILRAHAKYLTIDNEAQELLLVSAVEHGHDVAFWMDQVNEQKPAIEQIVTHLPFADQTRRKAIVNNINSKSDPSVQDLFISALWEAFGKLEGKPKQNIAQALWVFRKRLSKDRLPVLIRHLGFGSLIAIIELPALYRRQIHESVRGDEQSEPDVIPQQETAKPVWSYEQYDISVITISELNHVQVFISYAREDKEIATRLFDDLKRIGASPWLDIKSLWPGTKWRDSIRQAIRESRFVIVLFSSNALKKKGYFQKEWREAMEVFDEYPEGGIYFIPVRLDECDPPFEVRELHWVDMFPEWKDGFGRITGAMQEGLRKEQIHG